MKSPTCRRQNCQSGFDDGVMLGSAGSRWLAGGLLISSIGGQVSNAIQGWPLIVAQREADTQMIGLLGAGAFTLILVIGIIFIHALNGSSSAASEEDYDDSESSTSY